MYTLTGGVAGGDGCWPGALYVSRLGGIDRFTGLEGTHFAHRATILDGPVRSAENNNLVAAPNGRLVLGVSATCDHCASSPRYSGAIVSFRPDGTGLRVVANHVRAAYGLVYDGATLYASLMTSPAVGGASISPKLATTSTGELTGRRAFDVVSTPAHDLAEVTR